MVRRWRKDQANLFNDEIKLSAKRKTMGCFTSKYPELDQRILEWFREQRSQGNFFVEYWFCILKQQKHNAKLDQLIAEWLWVKCVTLKTIVVSCDNIVYRRFSLASFHKCQSNFLIIFHTLEKIFLQKISALNRDPL